MDGHADFGAVLAALHDNDARRTDGVAVELHRLGKARDIVHIAAHADLIVLFDLVARMGQAVDQIAVVGQQQQALGVVVETADRHDARTAAAHEIRDRFAAALILERGDVAARLVQHEVALFLASAERTAVHHDLVAAQIRLVADRRRAAVHGHSAVRDPALRLAARAKAGLRQ